MADVIAAPHHYTATDPGEGLHNVIFEDEAVFADIIRVDVRLRVNEAGELVAPFQTFLVTIAPKLVHSAKTERTEQPDLAGREASI
jgi:hypothetical protein